MMKDDLPSFLRLYNALKNLANKKQMVIDIIKSGDLKVTVFKI